MRNARSPRNLTAVWRLLSVLLTGCTATQVAPPAPPRVEPQPAPPPLEVSEDAPPIPSGAPWAARVASPTWVQVEPRLKALIGDCPTDAGLVTVAAELARGRLRGEPPPKMDRISFGLRRAGSPYVWPRAWALLGGDLSGEDAAQRVERWFGTFDDGGQRRCGVAWEADPEGNQAIAVLAADVLADLKALPTRAHVGQWVTFEATLLVPVSEAKVVLLGPHGAPRVVSAQLSGSEVSARFAVDAPGEWMAQLLPTTTSGPRPALEVALFVEQEPPAAYRASEVPGESAASAATATDVGSVEAAIAAMLNGARRSEGLPGVSRDSRIDALARQHAEAMVAANRIGHDLGHGGPLARLRAAGLLAAVNGENLAHATSASRAHRALWASPSHRGNMLDARFRRVGVGAALGSDGSVWVCQLFSS